MDALKATLSAKKRKLEELKSSSNGSSFVRKADVEKSKENEQKEKQEALDKKQMNYKKNSESESSKLAKQHSAEVNNNMHNLDSKEDVSNNNSDGKDSHDSDKEEEIEEVKSSNVNEVSVGKKELYAKLKDEDDRDEDEDEDEDDRKSKKRKQSKEKYKYTPNEDGSLRLTEYAKQTAWPPEKIVLRYFQWLLQAWDFDLNQRDESEKRTLKNKQEEQTFQQCTEHVQPLFRLCKNKEVPYDILGQLVAIVLNCEKGDFKTANDHYLQGAIGNAPWPIGLTMVGIHERSGREKIGTGKIAHVMNNELQRKYFTSVKRLISFAQRKRTDINPSMKVN